MLIKSLLAVAATFVLISPVMAQNAGWADSAPVDGQKGDIRNNSGWTDDASHNFYQQETVPANSLNGGEGRLMDNTTQHQQRGQASITNDRNGGQSAAHLGFNQWTTAGTVIAGSYLCPGCLTKNGQTLKKATLDSFVARSGYNDFIYGDEGTEGPPPYSFFGVIQQGGVHATTGHGDHGLPSSWY